MADGRAGEPPFTVEFQANPLGGLAEQYQWDFDGNGTVDATTDSGLTSHTYQKQGQFTASVRVVDVSGESGSSSLSILTQRGYQLGFEPPQLALGPGESAKIGIAILPVGRSFSAVELELEFNPQLLQIEGVTAGDIFGPNPPVIFQRVDDGAGLLRIAIGATGGTAISDAGLLARVQVRAQAVVSAGSSSSLAVRSAQVVNGDFELAPNVEVIRPAELLVTAP
jgi:PKD repeat protein